MASMDLDDLKEHARKRVRNLKLLWDGLGGDEAAEQVWNDRKAWRQSVVQNAASPAEYQHHVDKYWHGFDSDDQWKVSAFRWLAAPGWADNIAGWMHDKKNDGLARLVRLHSERVRALLVHWLRKGTTQAVSASVPEAWWVGAGGPMQNEVLSLMDSERRFAVSVSGLGPQDRPLPPFDRCGFQNPNQAKKNTRQNVPKGNQRLAFTKAVALEWAGIKNVITKMANRTNIDAKALKDNEDASGTKALVPGRPNTLANSQLGDGQPRWRSAFDREEEFYLTRLLGYSEEEASALERFATYGKGSSTIAGKTLARQLLRKWFSSYDPERPRRWHATLNKKKGARSGQTVYDDGTETGQTGPPPRWNADKSEAIFSPEDSDRWAKYNRYGRPWPTLALNPSTEEVKAFKSELERMRTFGSDLQSARLAWALAMVQKLDAEAKADGQQNFDLETFFEQMPPFEYKGTQLWVSGYDIEEEEWKKMEAAAQNVVDKEAAKTAAETANEAAQNALNAEHESQDAAQAAQDAADDAAADLEAAAAELTFAKAQLDLASQGAFPRLAFVFPKASVDLNLKNGTNAAELMKLKAAARRWSCSCTLSSARRRCSTCTRCTTFRLRTMTARRTGALVDVAVKRCVPTWRRRAGGRRRAGAQPAVLRTREKTVSDYDHLHMYDFGFENCTTATGGQGLVQRGRHPEEQGVHRGSGRRDPRGVARGRGRAEGGHSVPGGDQRAVEAAHHEDAPDEAAAHRHVQRGHRRRRLQADIARQRATLRLRERRMGGLRESMEGPPRHPARVDAASGPGAGQARWRTWTPANRQHPAIYGLEPVDAYTQTTSTRTIAPSRRWARRWRRTRTTSAACTGRSWRASAGTRRSCCRTPKRGKW